ncbi:MAG: SH3 domain-containing protein [Candidatus Riflebacteria bacterium]|nr:SH3 domain-containing protein [Candidatus Riflebacteria bacterium]
MPFKKILCGILPLVFLFLKLAWAETSVDMQTVLDNHNSTESAISTPQNLGLSGGSESTEGTVRVNDDSYLNVRKSPWGKIIGKLNKGDKVKIIGVQGDWYQINFKGQTCFVYQNYISAGTISSGGIPEVDAPPGNTPKGNGSPIKVRGTGYFPPPPSGYKSKAQAAMEGGANDCRGNPLRTLQDYKPGSYVSAATDPRVIKTGTYFTLDEYPGVKFLACDVGDAVKGNHIDICCKNNAETFKIPSTLTVRVIN